MHITRSRGVSGEYWGSSTQKVFYAGRLKNFSLYNHFKHLVVVQAIFLWFMIGCTLPFVSGRSFPLVINTCPGLELPVDPWCPYLGCGSFHIFFFLPPFFFFLYLAFVQAWTHQILLDFHFSWIPQWLFPRSHIVCFWASQIAKN